MNSQVWATVEEMHAAGLSPWPPKEDGSKAPETELVEHQGAVKPTWKHRQEERATLEHLKRNFYANGRTGVGFVSGSASGNVEVLEIDDFAIYTELTTRAKAVGLGELLERIEAGWSDRSPHGMHLQYRCSQIAGNTKLARRPKRPEEQKHSGDRVQVLIETRGEGGYVITAPSGGAVHPERKAYTRYRGGPSTIATITPEERQDLFDLAASFDQMPREEAAEGMERQRGARADELRPGDDFNQRATWEDTGLFAKGWRKTHQSGGVVYLCRPGKNQGISATLNYQGSDLFYPFTTSSEFDANRGYTKFSVYAIVNHNGDFSAAAKELARRGYGAQQPEPHRSAHASNYGRAQAQATTPPGVKLPRTATEPVPIEAIWDGGERCTDVGNSERLVRYYGRVIRYVPGLGLLTFDGVKWERDTGQVMEAAKNVARAIDVEAYTAKTTDRAQALRKHATTSEHSSRIAAMVRLAESAPAIRSGVDDLDRDPYLLNCANGTVDLRTGVLREHNPLDLITQATAVAYNADKRAPRWERFVSEIFGGNEGLITFVQRMIGYSLTGDTKEQVWFLLWGGGSNGKSTFLDVLTALMRDYAQTAPVDTLIQKRGGDGIPNSLARMRGARLVTAFETDEGQRLNESLVKQMTGGDRISARFLHQEFFDFTPVLKLFLVANHLPIIRGTDDGVWRRIVRVPFTQRWYKHDEPGEPKRDEGLKQVLMGELPGILAWAVRGCLDWQREGLQAPQAVQDATKAYRSQMDVLAAFLEECCVIQPGTQSTKKALYATYTQWCEANGEKPTTQRDLSGRLKERGIADKRESGSGAHLWVGLGLLSGEEAEGKV